MKNDTKSDTVSPFFCFNRTILAATFVTVDLNEKLGDYPLDVDFVEFGEFTPSSFVKAVKIPQCSPLLPFLSLFFFIKMPMGIPAWIFGVILMLIGTFMNNLGNNLMSLGHCQIRDLEKLKLKYSSLTVSERSTNSFHDQEKKGNWWLSGTIIFVIGALITFISFGFAPQSLLAALESAQFLSNVVFMKYIHGISVSRKVMWATSSILMGNILVVIFSSHDSDRLDTKQIVHRYIMNTGYQIFVGITSIVFFVSYFICNKYSKSRLAGIRLYEHDLIEPISFAIYAALIGSQVVLHSKNMSMIVFECLDGSNQFSTPDSYIIWVELSIWITSAVAYVNRINRGLDNYPPAFFIPILAVAFALSTIISGGLFFYEFVGYTVAQSVCFSLGVLMICVGVVGLSSGPQCQMHSLPSLAHSTNCAAVHPYPDCRDSIASCNISGITACDEKFDSAEVPTIQKISSRDHQQQCDPDSIVSMAVMIAPKRRRSFDNSQYDVAMQLMGSRDSLRSSLLKARPQSHNVYSSHNLHHRGSSGSGIISLQSVNTAAAAAHHQGLVPDLEARSHDLQDDLIPDVLVLKPAASKKYNVLLTDENTEDIPVDV